MAENVLYYGDVEEYLGHLADSYAGAHDVDGYMRSRFGECCDDDDEVLYDEVYGSLLTVLGIEEYRGRPVDPNNPPALEFDDAQGTYVGLEPDLDTLLEQAFANPETEKKIREWMLDGYMEDEWDYYDTQNMLAFADALTEMGLMQGKEPYVVLSHVKEADPAVYIEDVGTADDFLNLRTMGKGNVTHEAGTHSLSIVKPQKDGSLLRDTVVPASWLKAAMAENETIRNAILTELEAKPRAVFTPLFDVYSQYVAEGIDTTIMQVTALQYIAADWELMNIPVLGELSTNVQKEIAASNLIRHTPEDLTEIAQKRFMALPSDVQYKDEMPRRVAANILTADLRRGLPPNREVKALIKMLDNSTDSERAVLVHRLMSPVLRKQAVTAVRAFADTLDKEK